MSKFSTSQQLHTTDIDSRHRMNLAEVCICMYIYIYIYMYVYIYIYDAQTCTCSCFITLLFFLASLQSLERFLLNPFLHTKPRTVPNISRIQTPKLETCTASKSRALLRAQGLDILQLPGQSSELIGCSAPLNSTVIR